MGCEVSKLSALCCVSESGKSNPDVTGLDKVAIDTI